MKQIIIQGGERLCGTVHVHCAKNALLPILAAVVLADSPVLLQGCPPLRDVNTMLEILKHLGCEVEWQGEDIYIDPSSVNRYDMPDSMAKVLRSSIFMLGSIVGRMGKASLCYPGGCEIGIRPIDLHLKGLRSLGVEVKEEFGHINCTGKPLIGNEVYLDYPSVGATENVMMAAAMADGATVINNAAKEPEIIDLQNFMNTMGARISGGGSSTIMIHGVNALHGCTYRAIPDRIVAGTYLLAAAITGGDVTIPNVCIEHIKVLMNKLTESGCSIVCEDGLKIQAPPRLTSVHMIETLPYPGFPTDMQSQMMALQSVSEGTCVLIENVFENRFKLAGELNKMGANIAIKDRMAIIRGVERLYGSDVLSHDLRGGAALVLAGLRADGVTRITDHDFISRGYYDFENQLIKLGAKLQYTED